MADNEYPVEDVGGIQKIYCPYCKAEVMPLDSYQLSLKNERFHYPDCWQRASLSSE